MQKVKKKNKAAIRHKVKERQEQQAELELNIEESFSPADAKDEDFDLDLDAAQFQGEKGQAGTRRKGGGGGEDDNITYVQEFDGDFDDTATGATSTITSTVDYAELRKRLYQRINELFGVSQ